MWALTKLFTWSLDNFIYLGQKKNNISFISPKLKKKSFNESLNNLHIKIYTAFIHLTSSLAGENGFQLTSWCCEKRMKGLKYDNELNILQYILQMKSSFLQKSISIYTFSFAHSVISLYHSSSQGSIWSIYMLIGKYCKSHTTVNNLTKLLYLLSSVS